MGSSTNEVSRRGCAARGDEHVIVRPSSARVLVVGIGGLGAPVAQLLARAGVRWLGLADGDTVELSNLNRQILFRHADVGRPKVEVAAAVLGQRFPALQIETYALRLEPGNVLDVLPSFDFIIDATDGARSKYLLNDAAVRIGKPLSHAGILGLAGQIMTVLPGRSACLRCVFPEMPADGDLPSCAEAGILGPVAGAFAAYQAEEALAFVQGRPPALGDVLLTWDVRTWRWRRIRLRRVASCPACGAINRSDIGE